MRSLTIAALLLSLGAGPAFAGAAQLSGLPAVLLSGAAAEGTQHVLATPPAAVITAGSLTVTLDATTLAEVRAAFGGTIQHAADGNASADWLCYAAASGVDQQNIWFLSDGKTGGTDQHVTLVGSVYAAPRPDCPAATGSLSSISLPSPAPTLGGVAADLQAAFGAVDARDGMVAYLYQGAPGADGKAPFNAVNYLLKSGCIVGVAATAVDHP